MPGAISLNLRLPRELHSTLAELAAREHRSLNAQIIWMLERILQENAR